MKNSLKRRSIDVEKVYKILTYVFLVLLVIWRIPFLNKGIDFTDTGFNMTNYRDFFKDLSDNGIGMFFTNFIGAVIYNILPSHQLLVFRVLHLIMWSATFLLIYFTFNRQTPSFYNVVLASMLLAVSSYQKIGEAIFSYYPFSMLMIAIGTYLMYTAIIRDKKLRIVISGVVLGLSVGVRLPNVLFFSLVAGVFWYYLCKKEVKKGFVRSGMMIGGELIGLFSMLLFEVLLLGPSAVKGSASGYSNLASSTTQDHGIINQILHIFDQMFAGIMTIAYLVCPIVLACFVFALVYSKLLKKYMSRNLCRILMYFLILLVSFVWFGFILKGKIGSYRFLYVFGIIALAIGVVGVFALIKRYPDLSATSVICILSSGCIIMGTDLGITRFTDVLPQLCVLMLIGATYIVPVTLKSKSKVKYYIGLYFNMIAKTVTTVMIGLAIVMSVFNMIPSTYNDAHFSKLTTTPYDGIPVLSGMKTTPERAESFNNLHKAMTESDGIRDKTVVSAGMFPLLFNIVDNENYFNTSCIDYNSVSISSLQARYEHNKEKGIHPVIVISRLYMYQNELENYTEDEEKIALIDRMLAEHEYELLYTDKYFDVWNPIG